MRKDEEAFVICVCCVGLNFEALWLPNELPIVAILETSLNEYTILVSWEVCPTNNLTDEVTLRFEVGFHS